MNILIGCDPEVFVRQQGVFKSAHALIPGDKKKPFKVKKGAVQVDGMALEFNIDPAATDDEFVLNVNTVYAQLKAMVPEYEVVAVPVAHFNEGYMKQQPAEALELGCDPDYNAWNGQANVKPNALKPMRTASGHVHIGWTNGQSSEDVEHVNNCQIVGRQMDFFLGLGSLFYDDDQERRSMYGKGGCIRYKPYGVEYRTLSNAWLRSEGRMRWVFNNAKLGVERLLAGVDLSEKYGDISEAINNGDKRLAKKILVAEKIPFLKG